VGMGKVALLGLVIIVVVLWGMCMAGGRRQEKRQKLTMVGLIPKKIPLFMSGYNFIIRQ
jgi:hypothetical protein